MLYFKSYLNEKWWNKSDAIQIAKLSSGTNNSTLEQRVFHAERSGYVEIDVCASHTV
jgi:hypothetical protein